MDQGISLGSLQILQLGAAALPVQLFVLFEAPRIFAFVSKKIKKLLFVVDQGRNDCYL